jgi:hypothetical protein
MAPYLKLYYLVPKLSSFLRITRNNNAYFRSATTVWQLRPAELFAAQAQTKLDKAVRSNESVAALDVELWPRPRETSP